MTFGRRYLIVVPAALSLVALLALSGGSGKSSPPQVLEVVMRASAGTFAQVYWSDDLTFVEKTSVRVPLRSSEDFQRLRFPLPRTGARWLRFDPTEGSGEVSIRTIQLLDANGGLIAVLNPDRLHPYQQIAAMTRQADAIRVMTTPGATNASLLASLSFLDRGSIMNRMSMVTPVSLALVTAAVLLLLVAAAVAIGRDAFESDSSVSGSRSRWQPVLWMGVLFLIVFSAKLFLMRENPVVVPFWDQWDIEASWLYVPYEDGGLSWRMMLTRANEHRVFFTRLLALDLLVWNGQWDPRLQQVVDAGMHALNAVLVVTVFWLASLRRRLDLFVFIGALTFAPAFAWENTLLAIQSAAYLLVLFSILSLWLVTRYAPGKGPWLLGWVCAACALFTFGNGILATTAIMGVLVLKWVSDRGGWRELAANGLAAGLVLAVGTVTVSPPLPGHEPLRAKTIAEFAGALGHNLSWPWVDYQWLSVMMWMPVGALVVAMIWRRGKTTVLERLVIGSAMWVVLNAVVIAYGRGAGAAIPATRYMDYLSLGFVANAMALVAAVERARDGTMIRRVGLVLLAGWLVWVSAGVDRLGGRSLNDLKTWRPFFANHAANVRRLIATGDYGQFLMQAPLYQLPYPDGTRLTTLLQDRHIQAILPAAVRAALPLEPQLLTDRGFVQQEPRLGAPHDPLARAWWSLSGDGRQAKGRFESKPMACRAGARLRFQVSGYLGWQNQYLAVRDLSTGRELAVRPSRVARERWEDVVVPCPTGRFAVVAIDEASDSWFGFREPTEIGRAAGAVEWMIGKSREILLVALALGVLAARNVKSASIS